MWSRTFFPIVVSAPSGTGKTTLCREVAKREEKVRYSVSCTTRQKRKNEVNGEDYRFLEIPTFKKWAEEGRFLEWAIYQGSYYGTLREEIEPWLNQGFDVITDLEIRGARKLMKLYPDGVFICTLPPSKEELRRRLEKRNSDDEKEVTRRLLNAKEELRHANEYCYVVINEEFDKTVETIISIIGVERLKSKRFKKPLDIIKWET